MPLDDFKRKGSEIILEESIPMLGEVVIAATRNTNCSVIMGAVSVATKAGVVNSLKQWIWSVKEAAQLFPNPVQRGGVVYVKSKFEKGIRYQCTMSDIGGRAVAENFFDGNISTVFSFSIPLTITAGTYFVTLRDEKGAILLSDKVLIQ